MRGTLDYPNRQQWNVVLIGGVPGVNGTGSALCIPPGCTSTTLGSDYYMFQTVASSLTLSDVSGTPSNNTNDWLFNFMIVEPIKPSRRQVKVNSN